MWKRREGVRWERRRGDREGGEPDGCLALKSQDLWFKILYIHDTSPSTPISLPTHTTHPSHTQEYAPLVSSPNWI